MLPFVRAFMLDVALEAREFSKKKKKEKRIDEKFSNSEFFASPLNVILQLM